MGKKVDFIRLADALGDYGLAYLVTVDDEHHTHTTTIDPVALHDGRLDVGPVGGRTGRNLANRADVTLLWPPREPGGYSLIVDGRVETAGHSEPGRLAVVPLRAVLHRRAAPGSTASATGCLHDCMVLAETT